MQGQKSIAHISLLIILVIGIGIYLVQNPAIFSPKASAAASPTSSPIIPNLGFVFTGESNSGGLGANTQAAPGELAPTSAVRMLNNQTLQFEDLDIGTNNLIDHNGMTPYYSDKLHGFELQLANLVKTGFFANNPQVYLIKTGQGGSAVSEWNPGGPYWTKFQSRIAAAKPQIPQPAQWVVWYSLGFNDYGYQTPVPAFKTGTIAHLNKIKAELPGAIIVMTQFQGMGPNLNSYNNALSEIAASEPNVYVVDTSGTFTSDGAHWDYQNLKVVASRMAEITKTALANITFSGSPLSWISSSPTICNIPAGSQECTSTIAWNAGSMTDVKISIREVPGSLFASGPSAYQVAPWIRSTGATFDLYSGSTFLASVFVKGDSGSSAKVGDINNDGTVNILDFNQLLTDYPSRNLRSDVDKDGDLDIFDVNLLINNLGR